jgi:hypothetical protein
LFSDGNGVGLLGVKVGCFKVGLFGLGRTPLLQMAWPLKLARFNPQYVIILNMQQQIQCHILIIFLKKKCKTICVLKQS